MKKLVSFALAIAMLASMSVTSLAAGGYDTTIDTQVKDTAVTETYKAVETKTEDAVEEAIEEIKAGEKEVVTVKVQNVKEIDAETFAEVAKAAEEKGVKAEVKADTAVGGKVTARITFDAADAAKLENSVKLGVKVDENSVKNVVATFNKYFSNEVVVIKCEQQGTFGMEVEMAVKVDISKLDASKLVFYSYDAASNTYKKLANTNYFVDANGYVHFTTKLAGSIIVTDKALTAK